MEPLNAKKIMRSIKKRAAGIDHLPTFCKRHGLNHGSVYKVLRGERENPTLSLVARIDQALHQELGPE